MKELLPPPLTTPGTKPIPWWSGDGHKTLRFEKRLAHLRDHPVTQELIRTGRLAWFDPINLTMLCGKILAPMEILVAVLRQFGYTSPMDIAVKLNISEDAASEYQRRIRRKLGLEKGENFDPIFKQIMDNLREMRE